MSFKGMNFRAVRSRCAVNLEDLQLPVSSDEALSILSKIGYEIINIDHHLMIDIIRSKMKAAQYKRGAHVSQAPELIDCSSLTKWAYGFRGVSLPRYSPEQATYCPIKVSIDDIQAGDLLFTQGLHGYYWDNENEKIGHVGIATDTGTVIHAANSKINVVELPIEDFLSDNSGKLQTIKRLFADESKITTLEAREGSWVEDSLEFRYKVLSRMS